MKNKRKHDFKWLTDEELAAEEAKIEEYAKRNKDNREKNIREFGFEKATEDMSHLPMIMHQKANLIFAKLCKEETAGWAESLMMYLLWMQCNLCGVRFTSEVVEEVLGFSDEDASEYWHFLEEIKLV